MTQHSIERRINLRLLAYWEKLRGARAMPTEGDINPEHLGDLWESCFIIRIHPGPRYDYAYLGPAIAAAYEGDLVTDHAHGMVSPEAGKLAGACACVAETRQPLVEEGEFHSMGGLVRYRQCLLPLGDGKAVSAVFGGMRFRVFS